MRLLIAGGAIQRNKNVLSPGTSRKIGTIGACHGSPHVTHDPPINPLPSTARSPAPAHPFPSFSSSPDLPPPANMHRAIPIWRRTTGDRPTHAHMRNH